MKKDPYMTIKEVLPGVYFLENCFVISTLLVGKEKALLLDTGYGYIDLKRRVRQITDLPLIVVNSHGHLDHTGGNYQFKGPVYIHPKDREVYVRHNSPKILREGFASIKTVQRLLFWKKFFPKNVDLREKEKASFDKFRDAVEDMVFDLGGLSARVVELPGHTAGSIGIYCKERKLLLTGDAINRATWLYLPESTKRSVYCDSIRRALELNMEWFGTGHSMKLLPKDAMREYLRVAQNPDFAHGKEEKESIFAPGVKYRTCYGPGKKGGLLLGRKKAALVISEDKL